MESCWSTWSFATGSWGEGARGPKRPSCTGDPTDTVEGQELSDSLGPMRNCVHKSRRLVRSRRVVGMTLSRLEGLCLKRQVSHCDLAGWGLPVDDRRDRLRRAAGATPRPVQHIQRSMGWLTPRARSWQQRPCGSRSLRFDRRPQPAWSHGDTGA